MRPSILLVFVIADLYYFADSSSESETEFKLIYLFFMKSLSASVLFSLGLLSVSFAQGPGPDPQGAEDPLGELFFPPDAIIANADALGIPEEKAKEMQKDLQSRMAEIQKAGSEQDTAAAAVAEVLKTHPVDEMVLLEKLDALFAAENAMKRLHVSAMISIRNQLTKEQIASLGDLSTGPRFTPEEEEILRTQIQPKLEQFRQGMNVREQAQNPPPEEVPEMMAQIHTLIQEKELKQALELLDKALELIE